MLPETKELAQGSTPSVAGTISGPVNSPLPFFIRILIVFEEGFPASLAARGGHVTQFWPMRCM